MKHSTKRRSRRRGYTLVEILIVVTIMGLLAGMVGLSVMNAMEQARIDSTHTQLANVEQALALYKAKFAALPNTTEGLQVLVSPPKGLALLEKLPRDGWDRELVYVSPGTRGRRGYDLYSKGSDGQDGTEDDITSWGEKPR